jgi:DHA1 family bicyclomycin/chloramphenicol resistance-like MFS transporter
MTKKLVFSNERRDGSGPERDGPQAQARGANADADVGARVRVRDVLILGGLSALGPLSADLYLPALPALGRELGASTAQTQLTLSAGILGLALGQLVAGPSSDALGRRRPLLIAIAIYALASLACALAPALPALTLLRLVQGAAGGAGIAIALAVVSDRYEGHARARFFALLAQITGLAPILAPMLGGQLLYATSWRGIFVLLAAIGLGLTAALALGLGETLPPEQRQRGGAAVTLSAFRLLLADRGFAGAALVSGAAVATGIIYISLSPFVLQGHHGLSPQQIGLVFGVNASGIVLLASVSERLVGRVGPRTLLSWGAGGGAVGGVALVAVVLGGAGLAGLLPALFLVVASLGLILPNATALALANTQRAGSAAALLGVLQLTAGAAAAPLVGLFGAASALPMAAGIAGFGLVALAAALALFGAGGPPTLGE